VRWLLTGLVAGALAAPLLAQPQGEAANAAAADAAALGLTPGPYQPGWSDEGEDFLALLDQAPGGMEGNFLVARNELRTGIFAYGRAAMLAVPDDWRELGRAQGMPTPEGELREYYFTFHRGRQVSVGVHPVRRIGRAICSRQSGLGLLYAVGDGPPTPREVARREDFGTMTAPAAAFTICYTVRRLESGGFAFRYFNERGETLPMMDDALGGDRITIEPRAPLESYRRERD
jgi:hypothetical protein